MADVVALIPEHPAPRSPRRHEQVQVATVGVSSGAGRLHPSTRQSRHAVTSRCGHPPPAWYQLPHRVVAHHGIPRYGAALHWRHWRRSPTMPLILQEKSGRSPPLVGCPGVVSGGGRGIRTPVTVARKHAFQACAFSHSATPPGGRQPRAPVGFRAHYSRDKPPRKASAAGLCGPADRGPGGRCAGQRAQAKAHRSNHALVAGS